MKHLFAFVALALLATPALAQPASPNAYPTDQVKVARANGSYDNMLTSQLLCGGKLPAVGAGFGTTPSIVGTGSCVFAITAGTTPSTTGVLTFTETAANGWSCQATDITTNSTAVFLTKQTAKSTTSCTIGNFSDVAVAGSWIAGDVIIVEAAPY